MAVDRAKLGGIFDDDKSLEDLWDSTDAAPDQATGPIPAGNYRCRIVSGGLAESRRGTKSYKLTFEVSEGDHAGRRVWHDLYLTQAALPMAKRDLAKLGITSPDRLARPLPVGFMADARVSIRKGDNGAEHNQVKSFEVVAFEPPPPDPFAPADDADHKAEPGKAVPRADDRHEGKPHEADDGGLEEFEL